MFIAANVLWFVGGVAGLDYGNFGNLIQLFWSFSFAGIILGLKDLHGDAIPEDWRQGYTMLAAVVFITSILGSVNEDLNTTGVWTIVGFAIIIWAIRLGSFLFMRINRDKKDGRFDSIKKSFSQFFMTWTLQGMWVFICSSAALVAIANPNGVEVNSIFMLGVLIFISGFLIEVIADNQKTTFRSKVENKDAFINEGLWARSRHPNYFGEITLWTGISIMSISTFQGMNYLALFSPIFSYLLLVYVSGVRMLEFRGQKKWGHLEEYKKYKQDTPKLIPKIL